MRGIITILAIALSLSACASAQQIAAQDDATCQSYGAAPGTQAYFDCRMTRDIQRTQANQATARALATGLQNAGQQMSQRSSPPSAPVNCTSRRTFGNQVDTTCY